MDHMFYKYSSLKSLNLNSFDTSNVVDMGVIFTYCTSLISLNLNYFENFKSIYYGSYV